MAETYRLLDSAYMRDNDITHSGEALHLALMLVAIKAKPKKNPQKQVEADF